MSIPEKWESNLFQAKSLALGNSSTAKHCTFWLKENKFIILFQNIDKNSKHITLGIPDEDRIWHWEKVGRGGGGGGESHI